MELNWCPDIWLSEKYSTPLYVLGILCSSSIECFFTIVACLRTPIVTAGLHEKFEEFFEWAQTLKLKHLLTTPDKLETILSACISQRLNLKSIIVIGTVSQLIHNSFDSIGIQLIKLKDLFHGDGKALSDFNDESHPCFLSLTSGTTKRSRFCVVTQLNIISSLSSIYYLAQDVSAEDSYLSYINFSVLGEIIFIFIISISGGKIGLACDPYNFSIDAMKLKPTFLIMVSHVLDQLYLGIKSKVSQLNSVSKSMFNKAYAGKLKKYEKSGKLKHKIWDSLIFKKIKKLLGGNLRVIVTGSALINKDAIRYLRIVLGCEILEGYGMMECTVACCCSYPGDRSCGIFGGVLLGYEAKLHYTGMLLDDQHFYYGELMIKGPGIVRQYYNQAESVISSSGWYSTGDLVSLIPVTGGFKFIDRIANVYRSRSGRCICTQQLETLYKQCNLVAQMLCIGDKSIEGVLAIVVPSKEAVIKRWKINDFAQFCRCSEFKETLMREFLVIERIHKLEEHQKIVNVFVETEKWESDEFVTQTLTLRKYVLIDKYKGEFEIMKKKYLES